RDVYQTEATIGGPYTLNTKSCLMMDRAGLERVIHASHHPNGSYQRIWHVPSPPKCMNFSNRETQVLVLGIGVTRKENISRNVRGTCPSCRPRAHLSLNISWPRSPLLTALQEDRRYQ